MTFHSLVRSAGLRRDRQLNLFVSSGCCSLFQFVQVGALNAVYLAKRGYTVDVYEARKGN